MSASVRRRQVHESPAARLAEAVRRCRAERQFLLALRRLYEEVDRRLAETRARCLGGGACCKFDLAGHRLYLTAGELALLTVTPPAKGTSPAGHQDGPGKDKRDARPTMGAVLRCPYQRRGRCSAYGRRPLGCRLYFCRRAARGAPASAYEEFHRKLAALHERFGLPYLYVELTEGLRSAPHGPQRGGSNPPEAHAAP